MPNQLTPEEIERIDREAKIYSKAHDYSIRDADLKEAIELERLTSYQDAAELYELKAKALLEALEFVRVVTGNTCDKGDINAIKSVVIEAINNYKNSK